MSHCPLCLQKAPTSLDLWQQTAGVGILVRIIRAHTTTYQISTNFICTVHVTLLWHVTGDACRHLSECGPSERVSEGITAGHAQKETFRIPRESLLRLWQLPHVPAQAGRDTCDSTTAGVDSLPACQQSPLYADSVRRKRKHKMNKHKHRKRLKKMRHKSK